MIGFRQIILLSSIVPVLLFFTLGPAIGIWIGDIKYPDVLLSDLMLLEKYAGLSTFTLTTANAATTFIWLDIFRHQRRMIPEVSAEIDAVVMCVAFLSFPGLLMACAFGFSEHSPLIFFAHCLGAFMAFVGGGLAALVYFFRVSPWAKKRGTEHPMDAWWRRKHSFMLVVQGLVAGGVRIGHIQDKEGWCIPMLLSEVGFGVNIFGLSLTGCWRYASEFDRKDPILSFPSFSDLKMSVVERQAALTQRRKGA
jgi:hypothetical protein